MGRRLRQLRDQFLEVLVLGVTYDSKAQAPVAWAFAIEALPDDRYALFQGRDLSLVTLTEVRSFLDRAIRADGLGGDTVGGA